jgi:hypothetical protein
MSGSALIRLTAAIVAFLFVSQPRGHVLDLPARGRQERTGDRARERGRRDGTALDPARVSMLVGAEPA